MTDEKGSPERRAALLETCFEVFCKNGLENTGLKMLAEACGVTNGALLSITSAARTTSSSNPPPTAWQRWRTTSWRGRHGALRTLNVS